VICSSQKQELISVQFDPWSLLVFGSGDEQKPYHVNTRQKINEFDSKQMLTKQWVQLY